MLVYCWFVQSTQKVFLESLIPTKSSVRLKSSFDLYLTVQILKYSENFSTPIKHQENLPLSNQNAI